MAEKWVAEWLNDAFAIVVRTSPGLTAAETNLRRGLEAIVRHLATSAPPIPDFTRAPDHPGPELSSADLRSIRQALDACLAIFARHERRLNTAQRRVQILVRACRRNADDALQGDTSAAPFRTRAVDR